MPASSDKDDFDSSSVRPLQSFDVYWGNLELRTEQSAVNVNGKKTDGESHC